MRKKDKLYTANRFNQPLFMPDRERNNIFDGLTFGQSSLMQQNSNPFGIKPLTAPPTLSPYGNSWMSPLQKAQANYQIQNLGSSTTQAAANQQMQNFAGKDNAVSNPLSFKEAFSKEGLKSGLKAGAGAAIGAVGSMVGGLAGNAIAGGLESGAGNAIGSIGSTVGSAVGAVNPLLGAAVGVGSQLVGGLVNRAFGTKVDQAKLNEINKNFNMLNSFTSNAGDFDSIQGPVGVSTDTSAYSGGWFSSSKARRKNRELREKLAQAKSFAQRSVENNIDNVATEQLNDALANYSAFGGPLDTMPSMGGAALDYGLAMDYLTMKKQQNQNKNQMTNVFAGTPQGLFALGGDIQMNGGDFTTGLTHINAGGSHEQNPNEGVQVGVDQENVPNLVEEGETIFDDYVYSTRILADAQTKQMFRLPKARKISFADISKKLEKEASERPNDPISQAGLRKQMHQLADQQERQKQEMEAQRAKEAFEALSPEEQTAIMQRAAQEEQAAQQQQAMAEQAAMQQPSPEEIAMAQQQQQEYNVGQEPEQYCGGGKINRFDNGGKAYTKMLNSLGFHTQKEFDDWATENGIDFGDLWKDTPNTLNNDILRKLWSNEKFKEALRKNNPALAHAFEEKGYDFGAYTPTNTNRATIQSISKGNWKATSGKGWRGSEDLAFKQATEGMTDAEIDALTTEQLAERMRKTEAYQNTNKWLQNGDNALMYLNTLLNDPDTPQVAKDYAAKFVQNGKWKDGFNYDYATVFGSNGKGVRETNPGTYWHTAMEANRGNQAANFVINEDGSIEPILGDVPTDWTAAGSYAWATPENDYTHNYYKRPVVTTTTTPAPDPNGETTPEGDKGKNLAPKRSWEGWRYAGLLGPAIGLGLQAAGVGRPDTASLDAAISGAGDVSLADYKPLGNYLRYQPLDIWFEQNRLNANARATDRAILNSGSNQGSKMAGLLASGYNDQIASGNLFRQAQEYNDNLRHQVAEFNRGTDQWNSGQYGETSRFNASARNQARQQNAQLRLQAARERMDADAGWYNSLYGNVSGLFKGISDLGVENKRDNMINWMISKGIFGAVDPNDPEMKKRVKVVSAEGGQAKRKKNKRRGLTF